MKPEDINIRDYSYELPEDRIAQFPLEKRDLSKLLIYKDNTISESQYCNIGQYLPANSALYFNNTRVVQARLKFLTDSGHEIEIFCLEPHQQEISAAMLQKKQVLWKCLVGRLKKWKQPILSITRNSITLQAQLKENLGDSYVIDFSWNAEISFAEVLEKIGNIPIPPYLQRNVEESDKDRYQTVYAAHDGSVAAPTAGLHFTHELLSTLESNSIGLRYLTLHVGAGTFKPVKAEKLQDHAMHSEWITISKSTLQQLQLDSFIVSVGTTSLRTLESLYWMGVKAHHNPTCSRKELEIQQWDAYRLEAIDRNIAISALLSWMGNQQYETLSIQTSILIAPGYKIKMANALVTNFHQPQSTLILLVAACIGEEWRKVYQYALKNEFRFLSYGDGSLLFI